jgi:hypothetical protein
MASEFRTEKTESNRAYSPVPSSAQLANLWNLDDIRALNNRDQVRVAQLPSDFLSPSGAAGIIACDAGGATSVAQREQAMFGNGGLDFAQAPNIYDGELIAQKSEGSEKQPLEQRSQSGPDVWYHEAVAQAQRIMQHVDELINHHQRSPYAVAASPKGFPKCNIFLYDVMDKAGVPLPHGPHGERLTAANLDRALSHDPNFETVWQRNGEESTWNAERGRFEKSFHAEDGDIAIWNNRYLEHTCLLEQTIDGTGNTYYAGRDTPSGLGHFNLQMWWVESRVKGYGAPDAVYRYKHFVH